MNSGATTPVPGFYGKSPALGDFITRNLGREFTDPWDAWLQSCLAYSKEDLGQYWLETYLTSPLWRFVLSPSVCGPNAWAGILMPSVDRVGRNFPMVIACPFDGAIAPIQIFAQAGAWFERAEAEVLTALDEMRFDVTDFEARVSAVGPVADGLSAAGAGPLSGPPIPGAPWRIGLQELGPGKSGPGDPGALLHGVLGASYGSYSLWWSAGSDYIRPSLLVCPGLPPVQGYTSMIAAQWGASGWHDSHPESQSDGAGEPAGSTAPPGPGAEPVSAAVATGVASGSVADILGADPLAGESSPPEMPPIPPPPPPEAPPAPPMPPITETSGPATPLPGHPAESAVPEASNPLLDPAPAVDPLTTDPLLMPLSGSSDPLAPPLGDPLLEPMPVADPMASGAFGAPPTPAGDDGGSALPEESDDTVPAYGKDRGSDEAASTGTGDDETETTVIQYRDPENPQ